MSQTESNPIEPLKKPYSAWKAELEPERYEVLFEEATEPPRSSPLHRSLRWVALGARGRKSLLSAW
jgi:hypothetical protein